MLKSTNNIYVELKMLLLNSEINLQGESRKDFQRDLMKNKSKEQWIKIKDLISLLDDLNKKGFDLKKCIDKISWMEYFSNNGSTSLDKK